MLAAQRSLAATTCLLVAACGGRRPAEPGGAAAAWALTPVGNANLLLHPGDRRALQVMLAQDQVGPVGGAPIHFEFQDGDPAGARLETVDVRTDASGIATAHLTAGDTANGRPAFKLVATAVGLEAPPVAFSFSVLPVRRLLQILAGPTTHVASDGQSATVDLYVSSSGALKVRELDQDTGAPVAGDTLGFTLPAIARTSWSGSAARTVAAQTNAFGEAQVFLLSTASPEPPFLVVGQSSGGGAEVSFAVSVLPWAARCTSSQQCRPGQACVDGTCRDGGRATCGGSNAPCPFGYDCVNGFCQPARTSCDPAAPVCGGGQCCEPLARQCREPCPTPCGAGQSCVPGSLCGAGSCRNDPPPLPDVTGVWITKHVFSIRDALPPPVRTVFAGLRLLDQALLGKLAVPGFPKWLQDLIDKFLSRLLAQYIPDWVQTVIHVGDDLGTVVSHLRSEGSMRLVRGVDAAHVRGTEVWTSLVFYWLPLCNGSIQGDPDVPPDCARVDLATTDAQDPSAVGQCKGQSLPSISVQAAPFTATVSGSQGSAILQVDRRRVSLQMGKVVLVLADTLLTLLTPFHCIGEAADCQPGKACLVDCPQLAADISRLSGGALDAASAERACDQVVTIAGKTATDLLAHAWNPAADVLDFSGHAQIQAGSDGAACGSGRSCAAALGNDGFDRDLRKNPAARDGAWTGDFFFQLLHSLPGAWEAKRPQE